MEIVAVDRWLLQFAAVDEEESEAVAISCVEFLLSRPKRTTSSDVWLEKRFEQSALGSGTMFLIQFLPLRGAEQALDSHRFEAESRPEAELKIAMLCAVFHPRVPKARIDLTSSDG